MVAEYVSIVLLPVFLALLVSRRVRLDGNHPVVPALDPEVVARLLGSSRADERLAQLTPRELQVPGLMAEGQTNVGIARRLWLAERTVETHVGSILSKLSLAHRETDHRRVLAVIAYLEATAGPDGTIRI